MSKLLEELLSSSGGSMEPKNFVFFNDNDVEGYISQKDFLTSLRKQKQSDKSFRIGHLKTMFDNMALNRKLISEPSLGKEDGQEVIWIRFSYGNLKQNLQILNECNMFEFVKDYALGRVKNVPNFEELIKSISED